MKHMKLQSAMALTALLFATLFSVNAQTCLLPMLTETGTVLSAKKGQHSVVASGDQVTVKIKKTSGRAKTDVRVYVEGQLVNSQLDFSNGNYTTDYRTKTLNNVQGKNIMVQIDNKSVGNKFGYKLVIEGHTRSLMKPNAVVQHDKISGPGNKEKFYYTRATCGNKVRVVFRRTGGSNTSWSLHAYLSIFEKDGFGWKELKQHNTSVTGNVNQKIFVVDSDKELQFKVSHRFGTEWHQRIEYSINALSIN